MTLALGYLRTSSATNIGEGKDSEPRQQRTIEEFAKNNGYSIAGWFRDPAVSGADPVTSRPGFNTMLKALDESGITTVIVESADRFARDLMVLLVGHDYLRQLGIELVPANAPDYFKDETPTAVVVRQVLGAFAQFEKAMLVAKLRSARDRKRDLNGKCEGRKSFAEYAPEVVALARQLRRKRQRHGGFGKLRPMTLTAISAALAEQGLLNRSGLPYAPNSVRSMLRSRPK